MIRFVVNVLNPALAVGNISDAHVRLKERCLQRKFGTMRSVMGSVTQDCIQEVVRNAYKILGAVDILGTSIAPNEKGEESGVSGFFSNLFGDDTEDDMRVVPNALLRQPRTFDARRLVALNARR